MRWNREERDWDTKNRRVNFARYLDNFLVQEGYYDDERAYDGVESVNTNRTLQKEVILNDYTTSNAQNKILEGMNSV